MAVDRIALTERIVLAAGRLGLRPPLVPLPFFDAYLGLMSARALMAASSLGVFEAIAEGPIETAELARRTGLVEERLDVLLVALVTLGYLRHRGGRYRLTRSTRRWLAPASGRGVDAVVGRLAYWNWRGMDALEDVLRGGDPIGLHERPANDPLWPDYQAAMVQVAHLSADVVARTIPASRPATLLDLAGGPGVHAVAMCHRHPRLRATVVELEAPAALGRERLRAEGDAGARVQYQIGDLFEANLATGYDVVTAHSILHNLDAERCEQLLRRALAAARPGGVVAALETEQPPPGRAGSQIGSVGSLAFLTYMGTRSWTAAELVGLFERAGLVDVELRRPPLISGSVLVLGRRPV